MTKTSRVRATPGGLPEEIVVWEILVRLPPKSLLRCRAVCRAWRSATSTRLFLQAHHERQPCLPIVSGSEHSGGHHKHILAFDHRAAGAQLQPVARLNDSSLCVESSCDGLLVLSKCGTTRDRFCVCNPTTRQHAPLRQLSSDFSVLGMYAHRPTGEYRLLLHQTLADQVCCYVFVLGSDQPPRYVGVIEVAAPAYLYKFVLVRDCLHCYPVHYCRDPQQRPTASKVIIVFDTTSESFRHMRAPEFVPAKADIFEMDDMLGIYAYQDNMQVVDIWILRDYESEDWTYKHRVKLPVVKINERFGLWFYTWYVSVHSVDGDILLLVNKGGWMFHVDTKGNLVHNFHRDGQHMYACQPRLKQTLVSHYFFTTLEGYGVNTSLFV